MNSVTNLAKQRKEKQQTNACHHASPAARRLQENNECPSEPFLQNATMNAGENMAAIGNFKGGKNSRDNRPKRRRWPRGRVAPETKYNQTAATTENKENDRSETVATHEVLKERGQGGLRELREREERQAQVAPCRAGTATACRDAPSGTPTAGRIAAGDSGAGGGTAKKRQTHGTRKNERMLKQ